MFVWDSLQAKIQDESMRQKQASRQIFNYEIEIDTEDVPEEKHEFRVWA